MTKVMPAGSTQAEAIVEGETSVDRLRCRMLPDGRMTRRDAAIYLGFAEKTLAMWSLQAKGPKSIKIAGRRFYYKTDLDAFKTGNLVKGRASDFNSLLDGQPWASTSDAGRADE
jgi:hypothetical protein